ncbi:hypothetical protein [Streptomyces prunicolor]|uniref:hypothetical protein n=1 Tax=Streptomyces prunicolor TaxID=67348 RepID=UPI0033E399E1
MSDPNELARRAAADLAEVDLAADAARRSIVRGLADATGHKIAVGPPSVMDADHEQLAAADLRARHACKAMEIVLRKWSWGEARTLGELMPQLPPDVRELVAEHLARAGLS